MFKCFGAGKIILLAFLAAAGCSSKRAPVAPQPSNHATPIQKVALAASVSYELLPFDVPAELGALTSAFGNNNSGVIVGNFGPPDGSAHAFLYHKGSFIDEMVLGAGTGTTLLDINDLGVAVGIFDDANGVVHMYLRGKEGEITVLPAPAPDAIFAEGQGINNLGAVVGFYIAPGGARHGFIWRSGNYEIYDYPGTARTVLTGINDKGEIVGYWRDAGARFHGFLLRNGETEPIDFPGTVNTLPRAINNTGAITGYYRDAGGVDHGFFYEDGEFTTLDFPGAFNTNAFGINDKGEIVGTYDDFSRGFVATPKKNSPLESVGAVAGAFVEP
ncbi:MAG: DUF3466 family protein [candidate division Zixibacteria bacterium]|nr:DUF3466 family protein [candidate division Zixibacteria bacterium]